MAQPVRHPDLGNIHVVKNAVNLRVLRIFPYQPTPERGEHTDTVLSEFGYSEQEIAELREGGCLKQPDSDRAFSGSGLTLGTLEHQVSSWL
ncbi:MAG: hypothetical protein CM1200mP20_12400 [Pseudomonadota bacterium]|nr:MAG: hypothetical protein CM1200mP20_12400 [Pseudomonadota bacterium]